MSYARLDLSVAAPPQTLDEALAVAVEHFAFCPDNIWQGYESIRLYAEEALVDQFKARASRGIAPDSPLRTRAHSRPAVVATPVRRSGRHLMRVLRTDRQVGIPAQRLHDRTVGVEMWCGSYRCQSVIRQFRGSCPCQERRAPIARPPGSEANGSCPYSPDGQAPARPRLTDPNAGERLYQRPWRGRAGQRYRQAGARLMTVGGRLSPARAWYAARPVEVRSSDYLDTRAALSPHQRLLSALAPRWTFSSLPCRKRREFPVKAPQSR
ncbi:DUF4253 domain-containing protein [Streptomyces sp. 1222.5]|uniref:DUF4253 domain-containing protein n=1 Tax=Streptomyces sp. 1222.5 TaxID=1881026 RepID=UPI003D741F7D